MATEIGSLLIDMRADVARLSQDMAKAQSTVEGAMNKVKSSAAAAVTALGLIGVGVSVAGMANVVKGAVGAMAALDDMAAKAGTTVENMSALADVAKIGGHDLGVVEGAMVRLSKALAGGDEEAKGAGKALAALGLNAEKLRAMDTAEALLLVAQALDQYGNGSGKTALALDLLGKSGAAALPYLEDLAETGRLNASVTTEQAAAAEKLEKDINAVKLEGDKMTRAMVANMLPTMGDIAKAMRLAAEEGGTLKALFVGFGGLANEFVTPWKAAFLGLGAGLNEMLATFEDGLVKITFGGVAERHRKAALEYREAARALNIEIAKLDGRRGPEAPKEEKPKLEYSGGGSSGKASAGDSKLERMLKLGQQNLAGGLDNEEEQRILAEKRAMADAKKEFEDLQRMLKVGEQNELAAYYETAGEETMRLVTAQQELKRAGKDTFSELTRAVESWGNKAADAFADFVVDGKGSFTDLVNSMLKDIVRLQAKQVLDPITKSAGGFLTDIVKGLFSGTTAAVQHGGGIVGAEQAGFRDLSPAIFSGAPRLHGGGIAGDEMPAVLQKGEGVFTRGQMAALGGGAGTRITVNLIENNSKAGQVQQRNEGGVNVLDIFVDRIKSAIASDIADGRGGIPAALQTSYGLNRAPGGY